MLLDNLLLGFQVATQPINLLLCLAGAFLGTVIGVLPGIGPVATIAMLLPLTITLNPVGALIMLAGIFYGAQYGGSTTAILVNLPGEASSTVTMIDGHQMALKGRAGPALATAALSSFFAGTVSTLLVATVALPLTTLALKFGPPEYFALMVVGLISAMALASGSVVKALGMVCFGLLLSLTGTDTYTSMPRFTFGLLELGDGIDFVMLAVGIFGIGEILRNLEGNEMRPPITATFSSLWPSRADLKRIVSPTLRGTAVGSFVGILPGSGALLASFMSYNVEKKISPNRAEFGKGAIEGVAAPEAANNASAQTSFVPMLSLGLPAGPVMALMIGAMTIQGITPGPNVITKNPDLFWGLIASMWVGNAMLVILNLPLIGIWVSLLRVPYNLLYPAIIAFCCIGVYATTSDTFFIYGLVIAGLLGYGVSKLGCEWAPFVLGFVLGPQLEHHLRRSLLISAGDPTIFFTRPISATLLIVAILVFIVMLLPSISKKREEIFVEED